MSGWLHPEAEAELGDAAAYYAEHASPAVAYAFLAEFQRVQDLLVDNPLRGPHAEDGLRLYHFDRFPYTVIYESDTQGNLLIYAVAHQHRKPGYWTERTSG